MRRRPTAFAFLCSAVAVPVAIAVVVAVPEEADAMPFDQVVRTLPRPA